jgi:opacity protein-like surface antigen
MKKMFLMAAALVTLGVASQAATLQITCATSGVTTPVNTVSSACAGFGVAPGALGTINSITLETVAEPSSPSFAPATGTFTYSINGPGTLDVASQTHPTPNSDFENVVGGGGLYVSESLENPFNVAFTLTQVTGDVTGVSFRARVTVDYTLPQSGVPEPTTMALFGSALVGMAGLLRRRK